MANPNSSPNAVNSKGFNVIPMEQRTEFSSTVGELLPVYYDFIMPGEKVTLNTQIKSRTLPLNSAAYAHLVEHIDWFAVPIDQLYRPFSSWFYGIDDLGSDFYYGDKDSAFRRSDLPRISRLDFSEAMESIATSADKYFPAVKGTGLRLMELLDIPLHSYGNAGGVPFPMDIIPFIPAAYQKIYFDYYRLSDREANNPLCYNFDSYVDGSNVVNVKDLFTLRYRPWKKDFFTNTYVSPLFGSTSLNSWSAENGSSAPLVQQFQNWLSGRNDVSLLTVDQSDQFTPISPDGTFVDDTVPTSVGIDINVLQPNDIRTVFAVEKCLELTRRAGKHVDDQTLAHFGVKPSSYVSGEVLHIGHSSSEIVIGDVIATAQTGTDFQQSLGAVGGKGYGFGENKKLKWENNTQCPCVLMAIYSCVPDVDYAVTGLNRMHTYVDNSMWPHLEFDNLGMQPLFGFQAYYASIGQSVHDGLYRIEGWQWRWNELKQKSNRVCGALSRSMSYWTTRRNLAPYVFDGFDLSSYLVDPKFLDSIMVQSYDFGTQITFGGTPLEPVEYLDQGSGETVFDSDPLIHEFYVHCNKATKMSTYGLASL